MIHCQLPKILLILLSVVTLCKGQNFFEPWKRNGNVVESPEYFAERNAKIDANKIGSALTSDSVSVSSVMTVSATDTTSTVAVEGTSTGAMATGGTMTENREATVAPSRPQKRRIIVRRRKALEIELVLPAEARPPETSKQTVFLKRPKPFPQLQGDSVFVGDPATVVRFGYNGAGSKAAWLGPFIYSGYLLFLLLS